jgi:leader peptidase (prepilin peptidase)/N-methyltransferase
LPILQTRIGPPLLAVELLAAAVLAVIAARATSAWELAALGWLAIVAVPPAFIDAAVHRLPDKLTATAYAGTLALLAAAALTATILDSSAEPRSPEPPSRSST